MVFSALSVSSDEMVSLLEERAPYIIEDTLRPPEPPKEAREFQEYGIATVPLAASGNVAVKTWRVPLGYDGIILGQINCCTFGFSEGSGDIVFRLVVNFPEATRHLRDCGVITVSLGSPNKFMPLPGGLVVRSGNYVSYLVSCPNAGGSAPVPGTGNIICATRGYVWPR